MILPGYSEWNSGVKGVYAKCGGYGFAACTLDVQSGVVALLICV